MRLRVSSTDRARLIRIAERESERERVIALGLAVISDRLIKRKLWQRGVACCMRAKLCVHDVQQQRNSVDL